MVVFIGSEGLQRLGWLASLLCFLFQLKQKLINSPLYFYDYQAGSQQVYRWRVSTKRQLVCVCVVIFD